MPFDLVFLLISKLGILPAKEIFSMESSIKRFTTLIFIIVYFVSIHVSVPYVKNGRTHWLKKQVCKACSVLDLNTSLSLPHTVQSICIWQVNSFKCRLFLNDRWCRRYTYLSTWLTWSTLTFDTTMTFLEPLLEIM